MSTYHSSIIQCSAKSQALYTLLQDHIRFNFFYYMMHGTNQKNLLNKAHLNGTTGLILERP